MDYQIALPSKPRVILEEGFEGVYEIDGLYPGYGHTLGNSLRRIIFSSIPGASVTSVKIDGVSHEFSTIEGVKEDVVTILLNLKRIAWEMATDEPQTIRLNITGPKKVTAGDLELPGQVSILNKEQPIVEITEKIPFVMELSLEKGLGYVPRETLQEDKVDIGTIALDASFTPIRRANYEVENMRVGDRTNFNRLRITIETDGTTSPREVLERSIEIMIHQLKAIIGFKEEEVKEEVIEDLKEEVAEVLSESVEDDTEVLKTRIDTLNLSQRTVNALGNANIRTVGGIARKKEDDILEIPGLGNKGLQEIKRALSNFGITLKQ